MKRMGKERRGLPKNKNIGKKVVEGGENGKNEVRYQLKQRLYELCVLSKCLFITDLFCVCVCVCVIDGPAECCG